MQVGPVTCLSVRLAIYRDGEPEPQVENVQGTGPEELIHKLCTALPPVMSELGSSLPQAAVRALIENLLHAGFRTPTISVLDRGQTFRVADRGPGIADKRLALEVGFSSAGDEERRVIRGVGAGLATAARLMEERGGRLEVCDNLGGGTVVTLAMPTIGAAAAGTPKSPAADQRPPGGGPSELSDHGKRILLLLAELGGAALVTVCDELRISPSPAREEIDSLRRLGLLGPADGDEIVLTPAGLGYLDGIFIE
ncbi:MAG: hypothetical protein NVS9B1_12520 [Candidatus Dormibacteraceae bacterium]